MKVAVLYTLGVALATSGAYASGGLAGALFAAAFGAGAVFLSEIK